jgi:hypothetical protein
MSLSSYTGYFMVTANLYDCCGNFSTKTALVHILGAVGPVSLQIYDKTLPIGPNPWLAASTSISSPINVGSSTFAYQVPQNSGYFTSYTTLIEEVDNTGTSTGAGIIYNKTTNTSAINFISSQQLTSLCIDASIWPSSPGMGGCTSTSPSYSGYTGYWSFSNGLYSFQNYYKITLTIDNPCSTASAYSYVYVDSQNGRPLNVTGIEEQEQVKITIFPNPANRELSLSGLKPNDSVFRIELFDLVGKKMLSYSAKASRNVETIDISEVPIGLYIMYPCRKTGLFQS